MLIPELYFIGVADRRRKHKEYAFTSRRRPTQSSTDTMLAKRGLVLEQAVKLEFECAARLLADIEAKYSGSSASMSPSPSRLSRTRRRQQFANEHQVLLERSNPHGSASAANQAQPDNNNNNSPGRREVDASSEEGKQSGRNDSGQFNHPDMGRVEELSDMSEHFEDRSELALEQELERQDHWEESLKSRFAPQQEVPFDVDDADSYPGHQHPHQQRNHTEPTTMPRHVHQHATQNRLPSFASILSKPPPQSGPAPSTTTGSRTGLGTADSILSAVAALLNDSKPSESSTSTDDLQLDGALERELQRAKMNLVHEQVGEGEREQSLLNQRLIALCTYFQCSI